MKITNGKIILAVGIIHTLCTMASFAFGKQFMGFARHYFFKINDGFLDMTGRMDYETFAAFWCFSWGMLLFPFGILLDYVEKSNVRIPGYFIWSYLIVVLIGVYMIPAGGITIFMLPHALYMLIKNKKSTTIHLYDKF